MYGAAQLRFSWLKVEAALLKICSGATSVISGTWLCRMWRYLVVTPSATSACAPKLRHSLDISVPAVVKQSQQCSGGGQP